MGSYPFTLAGNIMGRNEEDMMWFEDGRGNRDFLHPLSLKDSAWTGF